MSGIRYRADLYMGFMCLERERERERERGRSVSESCSLTGEMVTRMRVLPVKERTDTIFEKRIMCFIPIKNEGMAYFYNDIYIFLIFRKGSDLCRCVRDRNR